MKSGTGETAVEVSQEEWLEPNDISLSSSEWSDSTASDSISAEKEQSNTPR